jgi:hypothetical protein
MTKGQEVMGRTNSHTFCARSTNKGSSVQIGYVCVYFYLYSARYNFCIDFSSESTCGPPRTIWVTAENHSLKNNKLKIKNSYREVCKSIMVYYISERVKLVIKPELGSLVSEVVVETRVTNTVFLSLLHSKENLSKKELQLQLIQCIFSIDIT